MAKPGEQCPDKNCCGQLIVRTSYNCGTYQLRYLMCNRCGQNGGKIITPKEEVFRRARNA